MQLSQLRQASRRLTTPLAARDSQSSRAASLNSRRSANSRPLSGGGATATRCSDGGTGSTSVQQQEQLLEERVAERKAEQEAQDLRLRLSTLEEAFLRVQAEIKGKEKLEARLISLESAQASLRARTGCEAEADAVAPSVRDLIDTFEQRSTGRAIPLARRSLPPPQGSSPL